MARGVLISFACIVCLVGVSFGTSQDEKEFQEVQERIAERIVYLYETNATYAKLYDEWMNESQQIKNHDFPCEKLPPSNEVPTSVHKLRPGDVKVIGAVGDSLTAGRAAIWGVIGILYDFPHLSWSIGGYGDYKTQVTLPNILKQYNPDLKGAAVTRTDRNLNLAVTGAKSDEELDEIKQLVYKMKNDPEIDFENDWKVITVFIGQNDLCAICKDYEKYDADHFIENVIAGLDYLQENVPRAFVNLVEVLNIEMVLELNANLLCDALHLYSCSCAAYPRNQWAEEKVLEYRHAYQDKLRDLVNSGRYDVREDFTVVLQPFYDQTYPPYKPDGQLDLSYFASDCFHESHKGQQAAAKALWNNMVEPVGSKRLDWHPEEPLECPSEKRPYLYTARNSRQ